MKKNKLILVLFLCLIFFCTVGIPLNEGLYDLVRSPQNEVVESKADESMADESMADESMADESMVDDNVADESKADDNFPIAVFAVPIEMAFVCLMICDISSRDPHDYYF